MTKVINARNNMIQCQLKPNQILAPTILNAAAQVDRSDFVPNNLKGLAYSDSPIKLSADREMLAPLTTFQLIHFASIKSTDRVLVIGSLTGYTLAVLSKIAASVVGVENQPESFEISKELLRSKGISRVKVIFGDLNGGHTSLAPYDVILIEGGVMEIPPFLLDQLSSDNGRLVTIMRSHNKAYSNLGQGTLMTKIGEHITPQPIFDAAAKILPGFDTSPRFQF